MKYKLTGMINFLLGGAILIITLSVAFIVLPRLSSFYKQLEHPPSPLPTYFGIGIDLILSLANGYLGFKLVFKKPEEAEKYFNYSIILILATIALTGILAQLSIVNIINPIYNIEGSSGQVLPN